MTPKKRGFWEKQNPLNISTTNLIMRKLTEVDGLIQWFVEACEIRFLVLIPSKDSPARRFQPFCNLTDEECVSKLVHDYFALKNLNLDSWENFELYRNLLNLNITEIGGCNEAS